MLFYINIFIIMVKKEIVSLEKNLELKNNSNLVDLDTNKISLQLHKFSIFLIFLLTLIPIIVLIGWQFDIDLFKRIVKGYTAMNPFSAVLFIMVAIDLTLIKMNSEFYKTVNKVVVTFLIFIGVLMQIKYIFNFDTYIDTMLFNLKLDGNRMAPNTSFNFILLGLSLLFIDYETKRKIRLTTIFTVFSIFLCILAVLGYLYDVKSFYGVGSYIPMALHTTACFLVALGAISCLRGDKGIMATITSPNSGGFLSRRLLFATLIIPPFFGWIRFICDNVFHYDKELGVAVLVASISIVFSLLIYYISHALYKKDNENLEYTKRVSLLSIELDSRSKELEKKNIELANKSEELANHYKDILSHKEELETFNKELKERDDELVKQNSELEKLTAYFVNRENKMVELKSQVKSLQDELKALRPS